MSYCNKRQCSTVLTPDNGQKKVLQALVSAELNTHTLSVEAYKSGLKANTKHSSATLLRSKLKGHLVRQLQEL